MPTYSAERLTDNDLADLVGHLGSLRGGISAPSLPQR
jgi:hypothetical protein